MYLSQLIDSILIQDYKNFEIIVVDDNSKDSTEEVMNGYVLNNPAVKYYRNASNMGCGYNRRYGFNKSKGEYIVFADDDDYYTDKSFLSKCLQIFEQDDSLSFVSGNINIKVENSNKFKTLKRNISGFISNDIYLENFGSKYDKPQSTFLTVFRRLALDKSEISSMKMVNDVAIYMRSLIFGNAFLMNDVIGVYRIHDSNITKSLSSDFIIENLEEKKFVFHQAYEKGVIKNPDWLKKQFVMTIDYYFRSSKYNFSDVIKLAEWGRTCSFKNSIPTVLKSYLAGKYSKLKKTIKSAVRT